MQLINTFVTSLIVRLKSLHEEAHEEGQTLVEYAMIIAFTIIPLVLALEALGAGVGDLFQDVIAEFS